MTHALWIYMEPLSIAYILHNLYVITNWPSFKENLLCEKMSDQI